MRLATSPRPSVTRRWRGPCGAWAGQNTQYLRAPHGKTSPIWTMVRLSTASSNVLKRSFPYCPDKSFFLYYSKMRLLRPCLSQDAAVIASA